MTISVTGIETIELEDPMGVCRNRPIIRPIINPAPTPQPAIGKKGIAQPPISQKYKESVYRENSTWRRGITWAKNYNSHDWR